MYTLARTTATHAKKYQELGKTNATAFYFNQLSCQHFFRSSHNLPLNGNFRCVKKNIKNAQLLQLNAAASFQLQTDSIGLLKDALEKYVLFLLQMFMHILCQLDRQFVYSHKRLTAVA